MCLGISIIVANTEQHDKTGPDFTDGLTLNCDRSAGDTLHNCSHGSAT